MRELTTKVRKLLLVLYVIVITVGLLVIVGITFSLDFSNQVVQLGAGTFILVLMPSIILAGLADESQISTYWDPGGANVMAGYRTSTYSVQKFTCISIIISIIIWHIAVRSTPDFDIFLGPNPLSWGTTTMIFSIFVPIFITFPAASLGDFLGRLFRPVSAPRDEGKSQSMANDVITKINQGDGLALDSQSPDNTKADHWFRIALLLVEAGNRVEAEQAFQKALVIAPYRKDIFEAYTLFKRGWTL
ncbi:MAG: hypothetical protein ACW98Y_13840 [Candidatus Thorarchaeota archaeon]|jgi:hypothetical protein